MLQVIYVGLGGFLGAVLRYSMTLFVSTSAKFPSATLLVNLLGSFVIGMMIALYKDKLDANSYYFLVTGLLGGFTTYSTFSADIYSLYLKNQYSTASLYLLTTVVGGLLLTFLGHQVVVFYKSS